MAQGSCLCGAIRFEVSGALPAPIACHCTMCRKFTGHYLVSCEVAKRDLLIEDETSVGWYASSAKVKRGFCPKCGSTLFFDPPHLDWIAIAMGAFDGPTGAAIEKHIFVADKGDYYELTDGLPQEFAPPK